MLANHPSMLCDRNKMLYPIHSDILFSLIFLYYSISTEFRQANSPDRSFIKAFFSIVKDIFTGKPIPFFCESWLLFSKMDDLLPEKSNIRAFKERFEIIHDHLYEKGDYSEMWRLYDMDYTGNLDDFPADSTLRRNYLQYLKDGGQVGEGYGVFFY